MCRIIRLVFSSLLVLFTIVACEQKDASLVILHLNDTHSHIDAFRNGEAGVLERCAFIDSVRNANGIENTLLLHGGDFSQGSSYFTLLKGDLEINLINAMGYDCVTLGNHEFDNDVEELSRRLSFIQCPVVCANYDFSSFELSKYVSPYVILEKAGKKIGIIGMACDLRSVVTRSVSDRLPAMGDDAYVINKWAAFLKEDQECNLVIVLSHMGLEEDCAIVPQIRNVDIIVGGHSHSFMDAPEYVKDLDGKKVPVVQDGRWGQEVGVIKFD